MMNSIMNALFGCSHRRTTFPLTPARKGVGIAPASTGRRGTYVVCLDCGKEFGYDWEGMRIGEPVAAPLSPAATLSTANR